MVLICFLFASLHRHGCKAAMLPLVTQAGAYS